MVASSLAQQKNHVLLCCHCVIYNADDWMGEGLLDLFGLVARASLPVLIQPSLGRLKGTAAMSTSALLPGFPDTANDNLLASGQSHKLQGHMFLY